jgi:hypothetical protein
MLREQEERGKVIGRGSKGRGLHESYLLYMV